MAAIGHAQWGCDAPIGVALTMINRSIGPANTLMVAGIAETFGKTSCQFA